MAHLICPAAVLPSWTTQLVRTDSTVRWNCEYSAAFLQSDCSTVQANKHSKEHNRSPSFPAYIVMLQKRTLFPCPRTATPQTRTLVDTDIGWCSGSTPQSHQRIQSRRRRGRGAVRRRHLPLAQLLRVVRALQQSDLLLVFGT